MLRKARTQTKSVAAMPAPHERKLATTTRLKPKVRHTTYFRDGISRHTDEGAPFRGSLVGMSGLFILPWFQHASV